MYTAAVLSQLSADLLTWIVRGTLNLEKDGFKFKTPQNKPLPHHMTINLGVIDTSLNSKDMLGQKASLHIAEIVYNKKLGIAASPVMKAVWDVYNIKTINTIPHITLCLKHGVKPKLSNQLLEEGDADTVRFMLDKTYILDAVVGEEE